MWIVLVMMGHGMFHAFTKVISSLIKVSSWNVDFVTQHESKQIGNGSSAIHPASVGMIGVYVNAAYAPQLLAAFIKWTQ